MTIHYKTKPLLFSRASNGRIRINCETPKGKKELQVDRVLQAIGRTPNTASLDCASGGVELDPITQAVQIHWADTSALRGGPNFAKPASALVSSEYNKNNDEQQLQLVSAQEAARGGVVGMLAACIVRQKPAKPALIKDVYALPEPDPNDPWSNKSLYRSVSNPNVWAIGDVTDKGMLTPVVNCHGRHLVDMLYGKNDWAVVKKSFEFIPTTVFSMPEFGSVGMSEERAVEKFGADRVVVKRVKYAPNRLTLCDDQNLREEVMMKAVFHNQNEGGASKEKMGSDYDKQLMLVGIHIVLHDAANALQGYVVAIQQNISKFDLDVTFGIHPSEMQELVNLY